MELSTAIKNTHPTTLNDGDLNRWARDAAQLERERDMAYVMSSEAQRHEQTANRNERAAKRDFYVACAVAGLLIAALVGQRFGARPSCYQPTAVTAPTLKLAPVEIRAQREHAVWL